LTETLKDRWNAEVEGLVRRVEETDWNQVRARWESRIGAVWAKLRESKPGDSLKTNVVEAGEEVKKAALQAQPEGSVEPGRLLETK
jgi:hypothetical protein